MQKNNLSDDSDFEKTLEDWDRFRDTPGDLKPKIREFYSSTDAKVDDLRNNFPVIVETQEKEKKPKRHRGDLRSNNSRFVRGATG